MNPGQTVGPLGRFAATVSVLLLLYWGLFALVSPVMVLDGQMYNVARIELAWRGGLFDNALFTSPYHVMWPWSFDATALPFVLAGWGYVLPSYLCLLGLVLVARRMVGTAFGPDAGWLAALGLLGLTCLVYQGSTTKNDLPITFAAAVWVYARSRWKASGSPSHLLWMAVSIGLIAGSKTTGVMFGALLAAWTLAECGMQAPSLALRALAQIALACLLLGSVETYIETYRIYGHLLGPPVLVDGLGARFSGPAAFAQRLFLFAQLSVSDVALPPAVAPLPLHLPDSRLGWYGLPIRSLECEEYAGYGLVGLAALATMGGALLVWRRRSAWWRLAIAAVVTLALIALTVAVNRTANRYLTPVFALGSCACVLALWECRPLARPATRWAFAALAAIGGLAAPLVSFNRTPADLVRCVTDRRAMEAVAFPLGLKVREHLEALEARRPGTPIYYVVAGDSYILPYLDDPALPLTLVIPPVFTRLLDQHVARAGDLVIEDVATSVDRLEVVESVAARNAYFPQEREMRMTINRVRTP